MKPVRNSIFSVNDHISVARTVALAVSVIFKSATIDSLLMSQLRCIRRDFVHIKKLAHKEKWADDTPVPHDVFGPMWSEDIAPYWADKGQ
jgi:hypothetical protein